MTSNRALEYLNPVLQMHVQRFAILLRDPKVSDNINNTEVIALMNLKKKIQKILDRKITASESFQETATAKSEVLQHVNDVKPIYICKMCGQYLGDSVSIAVEHANTHKGKKRRRRARGPRKSVKKADCGNKSTAVQKNGTKV